MTNLHIYLAQDRLLALAREEALPSRTNGSALFADISGFTTLTEALRNSLGARRGAEELTRQIEAVYSSLITQIELFGGSVIDFAGDSMLCWFNDPFPIGKGAEGVRSPAVQRAVACGVALQQAMRAFTSIVLPDQSTTALALKVAIASGTARRFVVGDGNIQRLDTLAGATVARTATAEHLANKGEVLVDETTASLLGDSLSIKEWRMGEGGDRFAVIESSSVTSELPSGQVPDVLSVATRDDSLLRPFIHRAVYERETAGQGSFLTEFRPCAAFFVRFTGIDFESDNAETELDVFICQVQSIVTRHGGTFLQLTIGDKGSYVYINFGALNTHEDNARRAVNTALELMATSALQLQIGITQGPMRVGAYGGETRKSFGALGDDVNLAARLMTTAPVGEILVSGHVHEVIANQFTFEPRPPLPMKGKAEALPVFAVTGRSQKRAVRLQEPNYSLPMVGRTHELQIISDKLDLAAKGQGQVIGIVAEAGLGKSRLVAEVIRSARRKGFVGYGGACQSDGIHTPYLTWKSIWGAFFDVDPDMPLRKQMRNIEGEIEDRAPDRLEAMPLLNAVLDLDIPENDFTQNLEPKIRQSALHALLEDCLKSAAGRGAVPAPDAKEGANEKGEMTLRQAQDNASPLLIVLEDLHWIDALSHDLLEELAKALANYAVCFVLAYRPPQLERLQAPRLEALPQFTRIELHELTAAEAESAIRAKLAQLYPARGGALPKGLVDTLMARAQGNPFYLEELLNYVRDRGLDPSDLHRIELPDSLHTLILSRIDQLSEQEKTTLRVASIVGRLFRAKWLTGYYPELGPVPQVKAALDALESLDITPLDSPEPELSYLFKHIITHEVTYESLPFATRAKLHEQLAQYLESTDASVDTIAFHYTHSENKDKQREYLRKAGEAAQKSFANDAALEYYSLLLSLLNDAKEQSEIHLKRGEVLQLLGKHDEAESDYRLALNAAKDDATLKASAQYALGTLNDRRGEYEAALEWLAQAKEARKALNDTTGRAQVLIWIGVVMVHKGEYVQAREPLNEALALARQAGDKLNMARAQHTLGIVALYQGDYSAARTLYEESLALRREIGDKGGIAAVVNNLGLVAQAQGDFVVARSLYEESLVLDREMGDKWGIAIDFGNLGLVAYAQGDYITARTLQEESLALHRKIANKGGVALALGNLGFLANAKGDYIAARAYFEESLALCKEVDEKTQLASALFGLGLVDLAEDKPEARENILQSLRLRQELGEKLTQTSGLVGAAALVLPGGDPKFTAQLLSAVETALKMLGAVVEPDTRTVYTRTLVAIREQLGEAAFQSAWEEGAKWSLEDAVKKALEEGNWNVSDA